MMKRSGLENNGFLFCNVALLFLALLYHFYNMIHAQVMLKQPHFSLAVARRKTKVIKNWVLIVKTRLNDEIKC